MSPQLASLRAFAAPHLSFSSSASRFLFAPSILLLPALLPAFSHLPSSLIPLASALRVLLCFLFLSRFFLALSFTCTARSPVFRFPFLTSSPLPLLRSSLSLSVRPACARSSSRIPPALSLSVAGLPPLPSLHAPFVPSRSHRSVALAMGLLPESSVVVASFARAL